MYVCLDIGLLQGGNVLIALREHLGMVLVVSRIKEIRGIVILKLYTDFIRIYSICEYKIVTFIDIIYLIVYSIIYSYFCQKQAPQYF